MLVNLAYALSRESSDAKLCSPCRCRFDVFSICFLFGVWCVAYVCGLCDCDLCFSPWIFGVEGGAEGFVFIPAHNILVRCHNRWRCLFVTMDCSLPCRCLAAGHTSMDGD